MRGRLTIYAQSSGNDLVLVKMPLKMTKRKSESGRLLSQVSGLSRSTNKRPVSSQLGDQEGRGTVSTVDQLRSPSQLS